MISENHANDAREIMAEINRSVSTLTFVSGRTFDLLVRTHNLLGDIVEDSGPRLKTRLDSTHKQAVLF